MGYCLMSIEFQFCKMKSSADWTHNNALNTTELYTNKRLRWYIKLCVFDHNLKQTNMHMYTKKQRERAEGGRHRSFSLTMPPVLQEQPHSTRKGASLPPSLPPGGLSCDSPSGAHNNVLKRCQRYLRAGLRSGWPMSTRLRRTSRPHWLRPAARDPSGSQAGFKGVGRGLLPCHPLPARRSAGRGGLLKGPPQGVPEGRFGPPHRPPDVLCGFPGARERGPCDHAAATAAGRRAARGLPV